MAKLKLYYYLGSDGECERCRGLHGYSLTRPDRPHHGCDCPIRKERFDQSDCELFLKNLDVAEGRDHETFDLEFNHCGKRLGEGVTLPFDVDERNDLPSDLEEFARAEGWSPPETGRMEVKFGVVPNRITLISLQILRYSAGLSAEVWLRCRKDERTVELDTGDRLAGVYSKNYEAQLREVNQAPCERGPVA